MSFRNLFAERLWQFCLCRTRFNALSHAHVLSLFILLQQALVCFGQRIYCYTWKTCTEYYLRIAATSLCFCSQNPRKGRRRVSEKNELNEKNRGCHGPSRMIYRLLSCLCGDGDGFSLGNWNSMIFVSE